jgi:hypothetical protein
MLALGAVLSSSPVRASARPPGSRPPDPAALAPARLPFPLEGSLMMLQYASPGGGGAPSTDALRRPRVRQVRQLTLAPQPAAMLQSRQAVRETLRGWKLDTVADTVVLLASELLTNAVQATSAAIPAPGGEQLTLTLRRTGPGVLVEVWDPNPAPAIPQDPGLTDEYGRGLLLVEALSSIWGQRTASSGKIVWCEITLTSADGQGLD